MAAKGGFDHLLALEYVLKFLRVVLVLAFYALTAVFVTAFILDYLISESSPITQWSAIKGLRAFTDPVIDGLTSGLKVKTQVKGYELMPLIVATVTYLGAIFVGRQLRGLIAVVDVNYQLRQVRIRKEQKKPLEEDLAFSSATEKARGGALLGWVVRRKEAERDKLLREFADAKKRLEKTRQRLAFVSFDIVGSTRIKVGQDPLLSERLFREYRHFLEDILKKYRHRASSWTPDGVMACFPQTELAANAAKELLKGLPAFNKEKNPLDFPLQVRVGMHAGEVFFDKNTPLELLTDPVLDLTGHLQKAARPDSLLVTEAIYQQLRNRKGFVPVNQDVDGYKVYDWGLETRKEEAPAETKPKPAAGKEELKRIGRYEIEEELGRGAMGAVYKARDPQIGRTVAIKMILTRGLPPDDLEQYKERFFREAQAAGQMAHPGIVTIYDISEHETGEPYLVMEYIEGATLDKLLSPKKGGGMVERFSLDKTIDIVIQVADALDYAHQRGVIHRDMKPANILITPDGKAKLADFGIAKMPGSQLTQVGQILGTPAFMSPEQFTGAAVDTRTDIFSLGAVLYWMCTGEKPFPGDTITAIIFKVLHEKPMSMQQLNPTLPSELDPVLSRAMAKSPDDRYQTAREFVDALEAVKVRRAAVSEDVGEATIVSSSAIRLNTSGAGETPKEEGKDEPETNGRPN